MNTCFYGDCREIMKQLIAEGVKVQMCVTSPPYWGLRDYGTQPVIFGGDNSCQHDWGNPVIKPSLTGGLDKSLSYTSNQFVPSSSSSSCQKCGAWLGNLGLEPTPELYVQHMVEVFRLVRELLKDDGTCWVNLGDSYAGSGKGGQSDEKRSANWQPIYPHISAGCSPKSTLQGGGGKYREGSKNEKMYNETRSMVTERMGACDGNNAILPSDGGSNVIEAFVPTESNLLKPKDLVGIPWMTAFALRNDGWYLRSDIIWNKKNPMPESVTDRPTKAHEYLFLLSKNSKYYFDQEAVREEVITEDIRKGYDHIKRDPKDERGLRIRCGNNINGRNIRSVWTIPTQPTPEAHFATFPEALIVPCIKAGSREGDIVLDPFFGSGTTGKVCIKLARKYIGCELQEAYRPIIHKRTAQEGLC